MVEKAFREGLVVLFPLMAQRVRGCRNEEGMMDVGIKGVLLWPKMVVRIEMGLNGSKMRERGKLDRFKHPVWIFLQSLKFVEKDTLGFTVMLYLGAF